MSRAGSQPPGKRTVTGKAEFAEQKGEAIAHPAHGPGKRLGKLEEQGRGRRQFGRFQGIKLFLKAAALARYSFGIADIAFDAVGVRRHTIETRLNGKGSWKRSQLLKTLRRSMNRRMGTMGAPARRRGISRLP